MPSLTDDFERWCADPRDLTFAEWCAAEAGFAVAGSCTLVGCRVVSGPSDGFQIR